MKLFRKIKNWYWLYVANPIAYARHIGVVIGDNCLIDTRGWSSEPYLIKIGNNVQITRGVSIHTHGGGHAFRQSNPDYDFFGKVIIEDWVYIGAYSQILPGITIGRGAIVAAGSIVTKSVMPDTVVAGNPAKFICTVEEYKHRNEKYDLGCKRMDYNEKKRFLLSLNDDRFIKK